MMPLTLAKPGELVMIEKITGKAAIRRHLAELGFVTGTDISVVTELGGNVIVQVKDSRLKGHDNVIIQDLPGIYSLSPYTLEEVVARNYLITEKPDAILNIVDDQH